MTPPTDLLDLVLALVFIAGCLGIHAGRHRPGDVTLLLVLPLIGTVNLFGMAVLSRLGPAIDPHQAALIASVRPYTTDPRPRIEALRWIKAVLPRRLHHGHA